MNKRKTPSLRGKNSRSLRLRYLSPIEKDVLSTFKEAVLKRFGKSIKKFILFGSRARGEGDEFSDLDIAVLVDTEERLVRGEIIDIATDLWLQSDISISPLVINSEHFKQLKKMGRGIALAIEGRENFMNERDKHLNIKLELDAGDKALKEAKALLEKGLYEGAISRLYHSIFHYVKALLYREGLEPKTHEGLERLFGLHYIKTSKVDPKYARLLGHLQKYREQADYGLTTTFSKEDVAVEIKRVEEFTQQVKKLTNSHRKS